MTMIYVMFSPLYNDAQYYYYSFFFWIFSSCFLPFLQNINPHTAKWLPKSLIKI